MNSQGRRRNKKYSDQYLVQQPGGDGKMESFNRNRWMRDDAPEGSGEGIKEEALWREIHFEELMAKTLSAFEVLGSFTHLHHDHCHWLCPLSPSEGWQLCMDTAVTWEEAELGLLLLVMFWEIIIIYKYNSFLVHFSLSCFFLPIASHFYFVFSNSTM